MRLLPPNMFIIVILLLGVSSSTNAHDCKPEVCVTTLGLFYHCLPLDHPLKPTPACCNALAPLADKGTHMNLCECFRHYQKQRVLDLTLFTDIFIGCNISVKLPPVPIPADFDCSEYILEGDSTVESYWALKEDPSTGEEFWVLTYRIPIWAKRYYMENNSSNSTLISAE